MTLRWRWIERSYGFLLEAKLRPRAPTRFVRTSRDGSAEVSLLQTHSGGEVVWKGEVVENGEVVVWERKVGGGILRRSRQQTR